MLKFEACNRAKKRLIVFWIFHAFFPNFLQQRLSLSQVGITKVTYVTVIGLYDVKWLDTCVDIQTPYIDDRKLSSVDEAHLISYVRLR